MKCLYNYLSSVYNIYVHIKIKSKFIMTNLKRNDFLNSYYRIQLKG